MSKNGKFLSKRLGTLVLSVMAALLLLGTMPTPVSASGVGVIGVHSDLIRLYGQQKTIDLSDSNIDIYMTEEDKKALEEEADRLALQWLIKVITIQQTTTVDQEAVDRFTTPGSDEIDYENFVAFKNYLSDKYKLYDKYWFETVDVSHLEMDEDAQGVLDYLESLGTVSALCEVDDATLEEKCKSSTAVMAVLDELGVDFANPDWPNQKSLKTILKEKKAWIYNDKQSDFLAALIAENLPVKVTFSVKELAADGSEDEKFGVDGVSAHRGELKNSGGKVDLPTVDFGAAGQFYDETLKEGIGWFFDGTYPYGIGIDKERDPVLLRDGMDFITHVMLLDGGYMRSTDDSRIAFSGIRGTHEGEWPYPGYTELLGLRDSLAAYNWGTYGYPTPGFSTTFNLMLNPAVSYLAMDPQVSLITDVKFDGDGRVVSVSKPVYQANHEETLLAVDNEGNSLHFKTDVPDGVYRYKLVETNVEDEIKGEAVLSDPMEITVDVLIVDGKAEQVLFANTEKLSQYDGSYLYVQLKERDLYKKYYAGEIDWDTLQIELEKLETESEAVRALEQFAFVNKVTAPVDVTGEKIWKDGEDFFKDRPKSVTVTLQQKVGEDDWTDAKDMDDKALEAKVTQDDEWAFSFTDLPATGKDSSGAMKDIQYRVVEKDVPEGYNVSGGTADEEGYYNLTNTYKIPKIIKTIEGEGELVLTTIEQPFDYEISTVIPDGAKSLTVEDTLESVLEFADPETTEVYIGEEPQDQILEDILTQDENTLKVTLSEDVLKEHYGETLQIIFTAKIRKDADLSGYTDYEVPNKATLTVDGTSVITLEEDQPVVIPPEVTRDDEGTGITENDRQPPTDEDTVTEQKAGTVKKVKKNPGTGDESMALLGLGLMVVSAAGMAALRRRKTR